MAFDADNIQEYAVQKINYTHAAIVKLDSVRTRNRRLGL